MNITFKDKENLKALKELKKIGYPDSERTQLTETEIKAMKIGTPCYLISSAKPKLMMYMGYFDSYDEFCFYTDRGPYWYKAYTAGQRYNVYKAKMD